MGSDDFDRCSVPKCGKPKSVTYMWDGVTCYLCRIHDELFMSMSGNMKDNCMKLCHLEQSKKENEARK